jgi:hypothetical protein
MVLSRNLTACTEENHEKLKTVGVLAEIRTEHVPNTSLERYF